MTIRTTTLAATGTLALGVLFAQPCLAATPPSLAGDTNGDGIVNQADIDCVLANWLNKEVDIVGPPAPEETVEVDLTGARVYTEGGWTIAGPNWVLLRMMGDADEMSLRFGVAKGGVKFLSIRPDFTIAEGVEP